MKDKAHILIVDDEPKNLKIAKMLLKSEGFKNVTILSDSLEALPWIEQNNPDIVLLDVMMPGKDGLTILEELRHDKNASDVPVIVLTSLDDSATKRKTFELGAQDFVNKPFEAYELIARVSNILKVKIYSDILKDQNKYLEEKVAERTKQLHDAYVEMIRRLGRASEYKNNETGKHVLRVSFVSEILATDLGLPPDQIELISHASTMHDLGKIGIPDSILLKPAKLTDEEWEIMTKHCRIGADMFITTLDDPEEAKSIEKLDLKSLDKQTVPLLHMAAVIALTHHEKWDGSGYPLGLKAEEIPIEGRITAVADVFDALVSKRAYKKAYDLDRCLEIIKQLSGSHFDPQITDAFFRTIGKIEEIHKKYND